MMANLVPGPDGRSTASQSDVEKSSWTASTSKRESSCLELLQWLSRVGDSPIRDSTHWLKAQSEVPYQMWCRPSSHWGNRIPQKTLTMSLAFFYHGSPGPSEMKKQQKDLPFSVFKTETDKSTTQLTIDAAFFCLQVTRILKSPETRIEMCKTLVPQKHPLLQRWMSNAHTI